MVKRFEKSLFIMYRIGFFMVTTKRNELTRMGLCLPYVTMRAYK